MRLDYVRTKVDQAVEELAEPGERNEGLYAAYLRLHTILPEHLPEGRLRVLMARVHDGFTKPAASAAHEEAVASVLCALSPEAAIRLEDDLRTLQAALRTLPQEAAVPSVPDAGRVYLSRPRRRGRGAEPRVLILFGTNEGHTQTICRFVSRELEKAGCEVTSTHALQGASSVEPQAFDVVMLAASLHFGRYQNAVTSFALQHHAALNAMRSAFISVSLSAANVHTRAQVELEQALSAFLAETKWRPSSVHHAAGAIRHTAFDYFRELATVMLMERRSEPVELAVDYDLTDYVALGTFARGFVAEVMS